MTPLPKRQALHKPIKGIREKGKGFEREIAKTIRDAGLDKTSTRTPLSGGISWMKSDIQTTLPIAIECKAQETTKFQEWYRQAEQASKSKIPVVVWKENYGQSFAFLKWQDLLEIMSYAVKGGWTERAEFHK